MSRIPSASPEVGVIRTYVDWLVGLPWNVSSSDLLDIKEAAGMPDVEAVYTGADLIADDIGTLPTLLVFPRPDGSPMTAPPQEWWSGLRVTTSSASGF